MDDPETAARAPRLRKAPARKPTARKTPTKAAVATEAPPSPRPRRRQSHAGLRPRWRPVRRPPRPRCPRRLLQRRLCPRRGLQRGCSSADRAAARRVEPGPVRAYGTHGRVGAQAREWVDRIRARYPSAGADSIVRLAATEFSRSAGRLGAATSAAGLVGSVGATGVIAQEQARLVLAVSYCIRARPDLAGPHRGGHRPPARAPAGAGGAHRAAQRRRPARRGGGAAGGRRAAPVRGGVRRRLAGQPGFRRRWRVGRSLATGRAQRTGLRESRTRSRSSV